MLKASSLRSGSVGSIVYVCASIFVVLRIKNIPDGLENHLQEQSVRSGHPSFDRRCGRGLRVKRKGLDQNVLMKEGQRLRAPRGIGRYGHLWLRSADEQLIAWFMVRQVA